MLTLSTCNEVGASDLVFIGKVELIEPMFLSRWNLSSSASMRSLNDAYAMARENPSAAALARLRDAYLKTFPDVQADKKQQVQGAKTLSDITSVFYSSLSHGMRVHFRVKTLFKHEDDDDAPKDAAAKDSAARVKGAKNGDDDDKKGDKKKAPAKNDSAKAAAGKDQDKDDKD
jgi:hypothetical protein